MTLRDKIQKEAASYFEVGTILDVAPRVGKSKSALMAFENKKILLVVPNLPLVVSWQLEFQKWNFKGEPSVTTFASLRKQKDLATYDAIIVDEIHKLSDNQIDFLKSYRSKVCGLTGTLGSKTRQKLFRSLGLTVSFTYTIEQAIEDGIIADYKIFVKWLELSNQEKIKLKNPKAKFQPTEVNDYNYWDLQYEKVDEELRALVGNTNVFNAKQLVKLKKDKTFLAIQRSNKLASYPTKAKAVKKFINTRKDRFLVFTKFTTFADYFGNGFHSKSEDKQLDEKFQDNEIKYLSVCNLLGEGFTGKDLKTIVFHHLDSNEEKCIQRAMRATNLDGEKEAHIYIFGYKNTKDEDWINKALEGFDSKKIYNV